jgi:hypothetical protein
MLDLKLTERGFAIAEFTDFYGEPCSIQKSSFATKDLIWLGIGANRMHLTQATVADLLLLLHRFVETGELDWKPT